MQNLVEVKDLKKNYGKLEVLKGLSFTAGPGEIIALLGRNGAGKSTLINILNDLLKAKSGDAKILGVSPSNAKAKEATGTMRQKSIVLKNLKVKEVLELASSYYKNAANYENLIKETRVDEYEDRLMQNLSGGQARLVNFAISLAGNPDVLFLDEPTVGMDAPTRRMFWDKITALKKEGKTIFITSHQLDELEDMASRILILANGVIQFDGSLTDLREEFGSVTITITTDKDEAELHEIFQDENIFAQGESYVIQSLSFKKTLSKAMTFIDEIKNIEVVNTSLESIFAQFEGEK